MINRIILKFGSRPGSARLEFEQGPLTVFVGPNNSGKSLILQELERLMNPMVSSPTRIVETTTLRSFSTDEARQLFLSRQAYQDPDTLQEGHIVVSRLEPPVRQQHVPRYNLYLEGACRAVASQQAFETRELASLFTIRLDGKTRLSLTEPVPCGDLQQAPTNHLMALFKDWEALERMRSITFDAFGLYFVIDPTNVGNLRVRLSRRKPADSAEEQSWDARSRRFHSEASDISEFGDGVKAYTGLSAALLSSDYRIILIDEPDAFLHPPLARRLGRALADLASERNGNVFASTHSSEFLMGAVSSGIPLNIVRLTYKTSVATARLLAAAKLQELMRDPMLRSTGVLSSLFHNSVAVAEGDQDRAFYQEINERLLIAREGAADGCLFLNAHNKQTERRIIQPLREMGIPAAAVVDIDILKGDGFKELLKAAFVPHDIVESLGVLRGNIRRAFEEKGLDMKAGGVELLDRPTKESANSLIQRLAEYGVFVVPNGEVESWLPQFKLTAVPKKEWLAKIFERMGTDLNQPIEACII